MDQPSLPHRTNLALTECGRGRDMGDTAGAWADFRGVFVLGTAERVYLDRVLAGCPNDGQGHSSPVLEFNDGSGWRLLWEERSQPPA
jgi:hypothetical protein